eukprot:6457461-Amphidinium_carterae.1
MLERQAPSHSIQKKALWSASDVARTKEACLKTSEDLEQTGTLVIQSIEKEGQEKDMLCHRHSNCLSLHAHIPGSYGTLLANM